MREIVPLQSMDRGGQPEERKDFARNEKTGGTGPHRRCEAERREDARTSRMVLLAWAMVVAVALLSYGFVKMAKAVAPLPENCIVAGLCNAIARNGPDDIEAVISDMDMDELPG